MIHIAGLVLIDEKSVNPARITDIPSFELADKAVAKFLTCSMVYFNTRVEAR